MRAGLAPTPIDLLAVLRNRMELGHQPIWVARKSSAPLARRLVAVKKSPQATKFAQGKARREAAKGRLQILKRTLVAAEWVILAPTPAEKAKLSLSAVRLSFSWSRST
jgi:hypothetical protein